MSGKVAPSTSLCESGAGGVLLSPETPLMGNVIRIGLKVAAGRRCLLCWNVPVAFDGIHRRGGPRGVFF